MVNIKRASEVRGSVSLPADPDLLHLTLSLAVATQKEMIISPVISSPLVDNTIKSFAEQLDIKIDNNSFLISPIINNPSPFIKLSYDDTPYREFILFLLLATGKTVAFDRITDEKIEHLKSLSIKFGCELQVTNLDGETEKLKGLSINKTSDFTPNPKHITQNEIHTFIALALGLKKEGETTIEFHLSTPLRAIFSVLKLNFLVKSNTEQKKLDPLARRIMMMKKSKKKESSKQSYTLSYNFLESTNTEKENLPVAVSLPGDSVLSALLLTLKTLIPTGQFLVENALCETWAQAPLTLIKKMGCKPAVQTTGKCSFGEIGLISIPKFKLVGRRLHCSPLYHYRPFFAALTVLANYAEGESIYRELEDFRLDPTDKIETLLSFVRIMGGRHGEMPDGMVLDGSKQKDGFDLFDSISPDINGAAIVAALRCNGKSTINEEPVLYRWPNFFEYIDSITKYK